MSDVIAAAPVGPGEERLRTFLQAAGVMANLATVATALLLQWGLVRLRRPRLILNQISEVLKDEDLVPLDFKDRMELFIRVRVEAKTKKVTAHNVEVLLLKVQRPSYVRDAFVVPSRQLAWADTPAERLAIPAGTWRRIDILKLTVKRNSSDPARLIPALKMHEGSTQKGMQRKQDRPLNFRWWLGRRLRILPAGTYQITPYPDEEDRNLLVEDGKYEFELAVTADEAEATRWRLSFLYKGVPRTTVSARQLLPQISELLVIQIDAANDRKRPKRYT